MAINRDFFIQKASVEWNGKHVCDVRGITTDDLARVMAENAGDMETLMETFERDKILSTVDVTQDAELSKALADNSGKMFSTLITSVPDLVAKIIAIACDEPDLVEAADYVRKNYVVPLQFEVLTKIAQATFVDANGFKLFLGNAMALVGNVSGKDQRQRVIPQQENLSTDTDG